jgi:hypothetical protein
MGMRRLQRLEYGMRQPRTGLVKANEKSHLAYMMLTLPSLIAAMPRLQFLDLPIFPVA